MVPCAAAILVLCTVLHDAGMELHSIFVENMESCSGNAEKDSVIDPSGDGADTFGTHDVVGCIGADAIDACGWGKPEGQACVYVENIFVEPDDSAIPLRRVEGHCAVGFSLVSRSRL